MLHTVLRWTLVILLIPAVVFLVATPADALIGDLAIIANQVTQIGQAVSMISNLRDTASKLQTQIDQLREQALGGVGALSESLADLSADPTQLLDTTVPWASDFANPDALELVSTLTTMGDSGNALSLHWRRVLMEADTATDADVAALFDDPDAAFRAGETWVAIRDHSETQLVQDLATFDAAEELIEQMTAALEAVEKSRNQTNLSGTALAQAELAAQITGSEIQIANAQLEALHALREGMARQQAEVQRRRELAAWVAAEQAWDDRRAIIAADVMARSANTQEALRLVPTSLVQ